MANVVLAAKHCWNRKHRWGHLKNFFAAQKIWMAGTVLLITEKEKSLNSNIKFLWCAMCFLMHLFQIDITAWKQCLLLLVSRCERKRNTMCASNDTLLYFRHFSHWDATCFNTILPSNMLRTYCPHESLAT